MQKEILIGSAAAVLAFAALRGYDVTPFLLLGGLFVLSTLLAEQGGAGRRFELAAASGAQGVRTGVTFDDIGGQEVAKRELLEALDFVRNADTVRRLGIRPLRGILLVGPPGTGKTLLAKAAASYVDAAFVSASGSQFVEMYAGVGAQRVRQLFKKARQLAAQERRRYAIVFIDEIEVLGARRGQHTGHLEYDQTLNELLVQMDGLRHDGGDVRILVVGATNRPDLLDPALTRPGRFDRTVRVDLPDRDGRLHILKIHAKGRPLHPDVDLEALAKETYGFSGAHLESLLNEAAILALRDGCTQIEPRHCKEAVDKVILGERLERRPSPAEKARIAYHEAGHAFVSELVRPGSVASVTITSRGSALGYVRQTPDRDAYLYTREELEGQIAVALAGAVAEEVFCGSRSTGALSDFQHAVQTAERIIDAGLSGLGIVNPETLSAHARHEEVQRILSEQERYVRRWIEEAKEPLENVAAALRERERLSGEEFRRILDAWLSSRAESPDAAANL